MDSSPKKEWSFDRESAIQEIIRGREHAVQLQGLLILISQGDRSSFEASQMHMEEILKSFTTSISTLSSETNSPHTASKVCQSSPHNRGTGTGTGTGTSMEKRKISAEESDQISGPKRSKSLQSWTTVSAAPHFDGHQWRKYGQKIIQDAKFPRSYFRCTNKDEQGCLATKQVQQAEGGDTPLFLVKYIKQHTCKSVYPMTELVSCPRESCSLSFGSSSTGTKHELLFSSSSGLKEQYNCQELVSCQTSIFAPSKLESEGTTEQLPAFVPDDAVDAHTFEYSSMNFDTANMDWMLDSLGSDSSSSAEGNFNWSHFLA